MNRLKFSTLKEDACHSFNYIIDNGLSTGIRYQQFLERKSYQACLTKICHTFFILTFTGQVCCLTKRIQKQQSFINHGIPKTYFHVKPLTLLANTGFQALSCPKEFATRCLFEMDFCSKCNILDRQDIHIGLKLNIILPTCTSSP